MCDRLGQLRDAMGRYVSVFGTSLLSTEQAAGAVALAAAIENMAATVKGLAAARAASGGAWKDAGDRSAAHHLARTTGTSVGQATEAIETARRLEKLPAVAAAARAGELSPEQAAAVADAASVDASAEASLVAKARTSSLGELREECARTKAGARPDAEARRRSIHAQRYLRSWADAEGAWNLKMRTTPKSGPRSWPPSMPSETACSKRHGTRGGRSRRRPTRPTPWPSWPAPAVPAKERAAPARGQRSSSVSTFRPCFGVRCAMGRSASWPGSARWPHRRSVTSSTPETRSWLQSPPRVRRWWALPILGAGANTLQQTALE